MNTLRNRIISGFKQDGAAWLETLIISAIAIYLWLHSDALTSTTQEQHFFWPLFGPLLVALRYGFAKGFSCSLLITVGLASVMNANDMLALYPLPMAVGMVLTAMIAGEFHDYWQAINQKHILDHQYMRQKLESFTQNYHLLKVSHDQLEQRSAGQTVSLRASISALHKIATAYSSNRLDHIGHPLLNLLAEIGGLEVAGIYQVTGNKINPTPQAIIGDDHHLDEADPMLQDMMKQRLLLSVAKLATHHENPSRYQLCIPLLDTQKNLQAIVVAESAKFFLQTPANNALLSLVASHAANLISDAIVTPLIQPQQMDLFLSYLSQAERNHHQYGVDSHLVVYNTSNALQKKRLEAIVNHRRGADIYWTSQTPQGEPALLVLLPLTTKADAQHYINRVEQLFGLNAGTTPSDFGIQGPLSVAKDLSQIKTLVYEYGAFDENLAIHSSSRS
ncbi:PelD GGDEF domain-containing protein [Photobacterium sp. TY1-4]|uniref:PelD GGDEF domain-containing protein n=1 Tax=Photobacterium sp. TY1-4 TaxID=2899122 RepID=UPI0021BF02B5|nr:PelD GGDEF domain-containing protein [Photobacterium sp. TY1-4]UXI04055.1 GAF domain-containing protein [Photobacterium sp. TY1-4]